MVEAIDLIRFFGGWECLELDMIAMMERSVKAIKEKNQESLPSERHHSFDRKYAFPYLFNM